MENIDALQPTQDERIMAALAHVTALMPFMGVIAPIVIWVTQREKSQYVRFQALQALVYQILNIGVVILGYLCYFVSIFGSISIVFVLAGIKNSSPDAAPLGMLLPFGVILLLGLTQLAFILYGIVAAVFVLQGKLFRYVFIGKRVERYLHKKEAAPAST